MSHDARVVANRLIGRGVEKNQPLTPMQIIKLSYMSHGWMLGLYKRPLINQHIEAWRYGPVIDDLYQSMKARGSSHVDELISIPDQTETNLDEMEINVTDQVFDKYSHLSGIDLSRMTHGQDTPWYTIWNMGGKNNIIPNDLIEHHYSNLANAAHARATG